MGPTSFSGKGSVFRRSPWEWGGGRLLPGADWGGRCSHSPPDALGGFTCGFPKDRAAGEKDASIPGPLVVPGAGRWVLMHPLSVLQGLKGDLGLPGQKGDRGEKVGAAVTLPSVTFVLNPPSCVGGSGESPIPRGKVGTGLQSWPYPPWACEGLL